MHVADTILREPADVYHANAKTHLTSHALGDFRRCPLLYRKKKLGLVEDEDRPAYLAGRALHTLVLEGRETFEREFAVGGPVNPKTGELFGATTKAFAEWAAAQGKPVLTLQQFDLIEKMAEGVRQNGMARDLLSEGIAEGVVRRDYRQMPSQARMDFFDPHRGIVDLKTCDDLTWFEADARRYGYAHQMAFYRALLAEAIGIYQPVYFVAVEKKEPYRCGVWQLTPDTLAQAQKENEAAIERLKRCLATDTWPTGYEECRVFDFV
ncbi:MAG: PD-(D/E)XK nuclease-like domain-containing protein [Thermoguttaceae bacterium]|jgi:hypothetical protein|nr:PD-(D/E)XK nuclease-like domain-containing protein [Thermoguttaceae bacterium]